MAACAGPLRRLEPDQVGEAAALAAAAFMHSASYAYIYEGLGEAERLGALTWLFEINIRLRLHQGGARCAFGADGAMQCFFMLQPPGAPEIGTLMMLRHGMLRFPLRFGWQALRRLLAVKAYHERAEAAARRRCGPDETVALLERMVVRPGVQGGGVGSRCLGAALEEASAAGHTVLLSTQSARNVKFYRRLGFAEWARDDGYFSAGGPAGPPQTNWVLARRADAYRQAPRLEAGDAGEAGAALGGAACLVLLLPAMLLLAALLAHPPAEGEGGAR